MMCAVKKMSREKARVITRNDTALAFCSLQKRVFPLRVRLGNRNGNLLCLCTISPEGAGSGRRGSLSREKIVVMSSRSDFLITTTAMPSSCIKIIKRDNTFSRQPIIWYYLAIELFFLVFVNPFSFCFYYLFSLAQRKSLTQSDQSHYVQHYLCFLYIFLH